MEAPAIQCDLLNAAYKGEINRFKRLALSYAKGEGIEVAEAIDELMLEDGRGSLHFAAAGGSLQVCKYLIETLKLDVDSKDGEGCTPLYHASAEGHFDTVRYLLEKGADPDASNVKNATPLHFAAKSGDTKIITLLLSRGVRVDVASRDGTALQFAAARGHRDAVKLLLDHGANPNFDHSQGMLRPLISAMFGKSKSRECMELLLQAGADPNVPSYGKTPLAFAAMEGRVEEVKRLLEAGADPNYKTNDGMTALEISADERNYQIVGVLFPLTSRIPTYPDWSITGLMRDVNSDANKMQREVHKKEKFHQAKSKGRDAFQEQKYRMAAIWFREAHISFPKDAAVLSNMSACYARLDDGINALDYATKCICERPEWPKAYYRKGVALNILKRYGDAADAFLEGLALDPGNKELKDAYMESTEARLNAINM